MSRTDVLVVGGGATGAGVARDLARRGLEVTLLERGGLAAGTSGRSHGVLHSGARYADTDPDGAHECIRENRILRRIAGDCVADTGGLFVSLADDENVYADRKLAACRDAGIDAREIPPEAAHDRVPDLAPSVKRVIAVPDAVIYPSRLVAATAADAREHGAVIHTHATVQGFDIAEGAIVGAEVEGVGTIRPQFVVNAAGAWAGACAALAGVDLPMQPTRGVMVALEYGGLTPVLNRCRPPDDGDIVVPHREIVVLGTTSVPIDDPDTYPQPQSDVDRTVDRCSAMLPTLADRDPVRSFWGVRPLYGARPDAAGADSGGAHGARQAGRRGASRGFVLLDHADDADHPESAHGPIKTTHDGVGNFASIVGGKLTTHRLMAEATADLVCERLGVATTCTTADSPLPGAEDPTQLDRYVREFDAKSPADIDVVQ